MPLAVESARAGIKTYGIDVDPGKITQLASGQNSIQDLQNDVVRDVVERGLLVPTSDFASVRDAQVIYICVPTPFTPNKEPDITYILEASESIEKHVVGGQCVLLKRTTIAETNERH